VTKDNKHGAFQLYVAVLHTAVAPLPASISFAQGSVLPLAVSTAAAGLYQPGFLELPLPSTTLTSANEGKTLLVWGGSSSVGSATVQLASASGLTVFATASSSNFEFVKSLGAAQVFDHSKNDVVQQIVDALKGTTLVGVYDAIALADTVTKSAEILKAAVGKGVIATVLPPPKDLPDGIDAKGGVFFFVA
jgi:NADPH:quinone reductase-like Zn-dependent oxidoreductase